MRNYLTILLVLVFGFNALQAQTAYETTEKSLLWEISGKSLESPSYLFGTIHLIPKSDYFFTETMESTFKKAKQVTFEIDMEEMNDMSAMFSMIGKMYMADGKKLRDLLSTEDYEKVKTHFDGMGLPFAFLERVKPMFLSVMTDPDAMTLQMDGGDDGGMLSYEMQLTEMAQNQDKDIQGLETMDFQMSLFDSIPYDAQAQMLVKAIDSEKEDGGQLDDMVKLYKQQDIQSMYSMMNTDEGLGGFDDVLLLRRNRSWIPVMEKMMNQNSTFFAVGAGHLGGPEGVVALLRKAGYTVTAVSH